MTALRDELAHVRELVHAGEAEPPASDWHGYEELIAASEPAAPARGSGDELAGRSTPEAPRDVPRA